MSNGNDYPSDPEVGEMSGDDIWSGTEWEPQEGWEGAPQAPPFTGPWPPRPGLPRPPTWAPGSPGRPPTWPGRPPGGVWPGRPPRPPWGPPWATQPPSWGPGWKGRPPPGFYDWYFYWGYRLRNAWKDIKYLKELVTEIVNEDILQAIRDGIIAPGPNSPVPGPGGSGGGTQTGNFTGTFTGTLTGPSIGPHTGPNIGVTDGSSAKPGEVGEILTNSITGGSSGQEVAITVTPGDWLVWTTISGEYYQAIGVQLYLGTPTDTSGANLLGLNEFAVATGQVGGSFPCLPSAHVSVSASTPINAVIIGASTYDLDTVALRIR